MSAPSRMRIDEIECIPVTIPIEAPILTSYGSLKSYARSIIRVRTDNGLVGYGDVSARVRPETIRTFAPILRGLSPWDTSTITRRIKNWNYYPWQKPEPIMAAIEMACLDIQGKHLELPLYMLLGGKAHAKVPVAGYLFYRHANERGDGEIHTPEAVVAFAKRIIERHGFTSLKLKGGYFAPETDRDSIAALRDAFGRNMRLRFDPQGSWTPTTAIRIGRDFDRLGLEYYEDPVWGASAMAQVRKAVPLPLATNMCVTQFDELYPAFKMGAIDIVLSDIWYWGGMRPSIVLDRVCSTLGLDVGVHSGTELAVGWAAMVHTAAAMPALKLSIDYMNMHLVEDIGAGERLMPVGGEVAPPEAPGLGVAVDEAKLDRYAKLAASGTADDRFLNPSAADSARPGWFPDMPGW
jgi:glucarate dehydratase